MLYMGVSFLTSFIVVSSFLSFNANKVKKAIIASKYDPGEFEFISESTSTNRLENVE